MLTRHRVNRVQMPKVGDSIFIQNDLFKGDRHPIKWWKGIFQIIPKFPTLLPFIFFPNQVTFPGHGDRIFKHLV